MSSMRTLGVITAPGRYNSLDDFTDPVPVIPDNYLEITLEEENLDIYEDDITCEFPPITVAGENYENRHEEQSIKVRIESIIKESFDQFFLQMWYKRSQCLSLLIGALITAFLTGVACSDERKFALQTAFHIMSNSSYIRDNFNSGFNALSSVHSVEPNLADMPAIRRKPVRNLNSELQEEYVYSKKGDTALRPMYVLPVKGEFTSTFSYRWGAMHLGIDIAAPLGTPIVSVSDGTVLEAGPAAGFGMWVRVLAEDGTINIYGHVNSIYVTKGQHVLAGQKIASVGNRGFATGPHLHFEVWLDGKWKVDPAYWLAQRGISLGKYQP